MYSYGSPGVSQSPKYSSLQNMWKETRCIFAPNLAFFTLATSRVQYGGLWTFLLKFAQCVPMHSPALLTTYCCFRGWWLVTFFCWEMKGLFLVCFGMPGLGAVCGLFCKWLPPGIRRPEANPRLPPGCSRFEPSATEDILDITLDFFPSLRCSKSLAKASCCLPTAIRNLSILSPSLNCGGE